MKREAATGGEADDAKGWVRTQPRVGSRETALRLHARRVRQSCAWAVSVHAAIWFASIAVGAPGVASANQGCPNEQLRIENGSTYLPDCRTYELVSPPYEEGQVVNVTKLAADGSRAIAISHGAFAGTEDVPSGFFTQGAAYELNRTASGWGAIPITPRAAEFAEDNSLQPVPLASGDLQTTAWVLTRPSQSPLQHDIYLQTAEVVPRLVGPMIPPGTTTEIQPPVLEGASTDLHRLLFVLTTARWPGDTTLQSTGVFVPSLYAATVDASTTEPRLVGVTNGGPLITDAEAKLISRCGTALGVGGSQEEEEVRRAVSADGRSVIFTALGSATGGTACVEAAEKGEAPKVNEVYARHDGATTVPVSEPSFAVPGRTCTAKCREDEEMPTLRGEGVFQGASEDGSMVFFTTSQPLIDGDQDATTDLYEVEVTSSGVQKLIQVSQGDGSDPTPGSGARVLSVSGVAKDGSHVYFVAEGVLTTARNGLGQQAVEGAPNLYVAEPSTGRTAFISTLAGSETEGAKVTPDGRFLLFATGGRLFEYEAPTAMLKAVAEHGAEGAGEGGAYISADGSYVAFLSSAGLTPRALNDPTHTFHNIYEYRNGQLTLISDGRDVQGQGDSLIGMDASGQNIFFTTFDQLVGQAADTQANTYDARVNGGFAAPATPAGCASDECRGAATSPLTGLVPASASQPAGGNLIPATATHVVKQHTAAQKLASALKACRRKHTKTQRAKCEARARRQLGRQARAEHRKPGR
jgi:hypothetical protein